MAEIAYREERSAPRSAARLAAVQALYQMDMVSTDLNEIVAEFEAHRLDGDIDGDVLSAADRDLFRSLLAGVVRDQRVLDPMVARHLAEGWRLARIDSTLRAILRSGAFELSALGDVPARVVINEYVEIAHAFFDGDEPKVVNAILDRLARELRPAEFNPG